MWQKLGFFFCLVSLVSCVGHNGADVLTHPQEHASCNKALCASIVSYCMIQEKCGCHPRKNCSCCTECAICLGDHYMQCCDCVGKTAVSLYCFFGLFRLLVLATFFFFEKLVCCSSCRLLCSVQLCLRGLHLFKVKTEAVFVKFL